MVIKTDLDSMLDESDFGASTEMGGFALDKIPEVSLAPEYFWMSKFTSSASFGAAVKLSVSNNFCPSGSLNTKLPTLRLLLMQSLQIQFSTFLNAWVQY